jgi:hypothetical protein
MTLQTDIAKIQELCDKMLADLAVEDAEPVKPDPDPDPQTTKIVSVYSTDWITCNIVRNYGFLRSDFWIALNVAAKAAGGMTLRQACPPAGETWTESPAHKSDGLRTDFDYPYLADGSLDVEKLTIFVSEMRRQRKQVEFIMAASMEGLFPINYRIVFTDDRNHNTHLDCYWGVDR